MTPLETLSRIIKRRRYKIGFVNGCFDCLHHGHLHLLRSARTQCDVLFVGVNDDASVKERKGIGRPVVPLERRIDALQATGLCDGIFGFRTESDLACIIRQISPDCLVKGEDYRGKAITGDTGNVVYVGLLPGYSTTKLLQSQ